MGLMNLMGNTRNPCKGVTRVTEYLWRALAWLVSRTTVADFLIKRAQSTPYAHLDGYMNRWWLFNGYDPLDKSKSRGRWLPSIRIHHILRADNARHMHDHPWNARTIILRGAYSEERLDGSCYLRTVGSTAKLNYGEFHHITHVTEGGVWTMFLSWRYKGTWGFNVDGKKVPWREYEELTCD